MTNAFQIALNRLPHGPEFRFLDRLLELNPGQSGIASYTVRGDEPFLRGHFPGNPLFPGALLIEAAAQLAGTIAQSDPHIPPLPNLKLTAVRAAKILQSAVPGDTLQFHATILARFDNLVHATATASLNNQIIFHTELTLSGEKR